ncbi:hypothetical protein [Catenovulum sediminis]|uniref:Uncharacterized protein n=1 Tax=Catenovulum sediminis TaxID=1740262 RepID=A0ABV1RFH0_9ALTE|nr:hypothetical protein [Catenovulum sediminis]
MAQKKYERKLVLDPNQWWEHLSLAQKFSANSLFQYGYQLAFIRDTEEGKLAVLLREDDIVTLSEEGDIDSEPSIILRT